MENGRKITGIISRETSDTVLIEMHGVKLTLKQSEIARIDRMDSEMRKKAIQEIRSPRPHEDAYYPESARPLFHAMADLDDLKKQWFRATQRTETIENQLKVRKSEIVRLDRTIKVGKKQLDGFSVGAGSSTLANNKRIEDHNRLVHQTNLFIEQLRNAYDGSQQLEKDLAGVYKQGSLKRKQYAQRAHRVGENWMLFAKKFDGESSAPSPWFAELSRRMDAHPIAFQARDESDEPPFVLTSDGQKDYTLPRHADGHFYVTASLNDIRLEEFLIDTGATVSLLPESIGKAAGARRIGPAIKTQVADGRTVDVFPAILEEVEIYGQSFTNVMVGLMADLGPHKIPNLLGMNIIAQIPMSLTTEGLVITIKPDAE